MNYSDILFKAFLGAIGAGAATAIIAIIKKAVARQAEERKEIKEGIASIKKNVSSMVNNGKKRAGENQVQFKMLNAHGEAITAMLEVVAKNQNNGNVEKAFKSLDESKEAYKDYVDANLIKTEEG